MNKTVLRPQNRTPLRLALGKAYFRLRRRLGSNPPFLMPSSDRLPHQHFTHQSPLLRKLKDVDMQLQHNKIINLKIAVAKINGVILQPSQSLSYWRQIGKPTRRKGYVEGMLLERGRVRAGIGGGLCQLSNLIYWMSLHTPLSITERHRHSFDVFPDSGRTQPFGSGATCFYNYIDLQIKNETSQPFQLVLELTDSQLVGKWLSTTPPIHHYELYEKDHIIQSQPWGGYTRHNSIYRRVFDEEGRQIDEQFVTENHAIMMYNPLLPEKA